MKRKKKTKNLVFDARDLGSGSGNGESENVFAGYIRRRVEREPLKPKPERNRCAMPTPKSKRKKPFNTTNDWSPKTVPSTNAVEKLAIPKARAALITTALSDYK